MRHSTAPIRMWASAALGAALLGTSVLTGVSAANAASAGSAAVIALTPGTTGGSGTALYGAVANTVLTFDDPLCNRALPVDETATVTVTIGTSQYVSPPLSSWSASTKVQNVTGCSYSGGSNPTAKGTVTTTWKTWSFDYTCQPAGTVATGSSQNIPWAPPATVPDNGPLPASCTEPVSTQPAPAPPSPTPTPRPAPTMEFSAASGPVGSTFTISGTGSNPGAQAYAKFDTHAIGSTTVGEDGAYLLRLTVPTWASVGQHLVTVGTGGDGFPVNVPFTVTAPAAGPAVTVTPSSGAPGAAFTVDGVGYGPNESVQVIFGSTTLQILTADAAGHFSYRGTVPEDALPGERTVSAASENVGARAASFTVTAPPAPSQPAPALSAATGVAGNHFTVSGSHYAPGETVTVEFHSTPVTLGTATVAADGTFSLDATVPADAPAGSHTVTITAASTGTQSIPFTVAAATSPSSSATPTPTPTQSTGNDGCGGCTGTPTPTPTKSTPEEECGCTPAPSESEAAPTPSESAAAPQPTSGGPGRGLAVQTAVDAQAGAAGTQAALTVWSAATGILGLGCAAAFVAFFRRSRRES